MILLDGALKGDVRRAADDDVRRIVIHQCEEVVVGEVVADLSVGVGRGAVNHQDLAAVDQWYPLLLGQAAKPLRDEVADRSPRLRKQTGLAALLLVDRDQAARIDRAERQVGGPTGADRPQALQALPHLEWLIAAEE